MAYRITYEWQKEQELNRKTGPSKGLVLGMVIAAAALGLRLLVPESEQVFRELFYPLTDEYTLSVFGELAERIGEGVPLPEAATVFCREIIEHGR